MRADELFTEGLDARIGVVRKTGAGGVLVSGLEYDSRAVGPESLYFALPGLHSDGHDFVKEAVSKGASVIVHQNALDAYDGNVFYVQVRDSRYAMSAVADAFYGSPSSRLLVAGVTGTEGKSTTVYLVFQLLRLAGKKAGFISTVQYSVDGTERWNTEHQTTPEAVLVQRRLAEMLDNGCEYAVLEASSHGLSPRTNRLGDVLFDAGVMTNVMHEHLEFHGTWEQYRHDKANLFRSLGRGRGQKAVKGGAFGVVNADDPSAAYFADCADCRVFTYSTKGTDADLSASNLTAFPHGSAYDVTIPGGTFRVEDRLPGSFNAGNVLAALLCASGLLNVPVRDLLPLVPLLKPVRGRMTAVRMGQPFEVVVDYAHTPSSFEALFPPLRERLDRTGGRIIALFGSAGERDTRKRPAQGRIAARYSDMIFLCDEDPREEDPMLILEEIASGAEDFEKGKFRRGENLFLVPDRPTAIRKAFAAAKAGDLVLLLGKGHENSIIYSRHTVKYDEIDEAEKAVLELLEKGVKRKPLNP